MAAARTGVGPLIRERRASAHRSQLDLALDVGVSARHLSFVELGKTTSGSGLAHAALAAPFIPTVVGTDTYVDELW